MKSKHIQGEFQLPDVEWVKDLDLLDTMMKMQRTFNAKFYNPNKLTQAEVQDFLLKYSMAAYSEIGELSDEFNWKPWKTKFQPNELDLKLEIIDLMCFVLSMFDVMAMKPEEIFSLYTLKMKENQNRQDRGY